MTTQYYPQIKFALGLPKDENGLVDFILLPISEWGEKLIVELDSHVYNKTFEEMVEKIERVYIPLAIKKDYYWGRYPVVDSEFPWSPTTCVFHKDYLRSFRPEPMDLETDWVKKSLERQS